MDKRRKDLFIKIVLWLLVLIWMASIFYFSSENADDSTDTSDTVTEAVLEVVVKDFKLKTEAEKRILITDLTNIIRKSAHFLEYTLLGILTYLAISRHSSSGKFRISVSFAICAVYSASDEIHQLFVEGRACRFTDMLIDCSGGLLGIIIMHMIFLLVLKIKNKKISKQGANQYGRQD